MAKGWRFLEGFMAGAAGALVVVGGALWGLTNSGLIELAEPAAGLPDPGAWLGWAADNLGWSTVVFGVLLAAFVGTLLMAHSDDDGLVLPVDSITAERLAKYICGQFMASLNEQKRSSLTSITVGVEEAPGQTAFYYVRVMQIPTARHSLLDAIALGQAHAANHPDTLQERAYSSPIWVTP